MRDKSVRGKNEQGERKTEENYIKTGKKALKVHLFGLLTTKIFASLFVGENNLKRGEEGGMHNIYP